MTAVEQIQHVLKQYILDFQFVGSFKASNVSGHTLKSFANFFKISHFLLRDGIYLICAHGSKPWDAIPIIFYIGQTKKCVISRIFNHLKSLLNILWKTESTGRSFAKFAIDSTQTFDIYMIDSEVLGITNHEESMMCEKAFQNIFKVIVRDTKYVK